MAEREAFLPREPQRIAIPFLLAHERCNLFASMGIGKSVSVATALDALAAAGEGRPALIMAPLRVASLAWPADLGKWKHLAHMEHVNLTGTPKQREAALKELAKGNAQVALVNYEQLPNLYQHFGRKLWPFGVHVADESTRLKGFRLQGQGTLRACTIGKIAWLPGVRWWNLTGTPCPAGYQDLWGQHWFVDGGDALGRTHTDFKMRWFRQVPGSEFGETELMPHAAEEIRQLAAPLSLVLRAQDYFDLPPVTHNIVPVALPPAARKLYREMEKEMFVQLGERGVEAGTAAAKSMKCRQLASGSIYYDKNKWEHVHDAKVDALRSVVNECFGMPLLVVYYFQADLEKLVKAFPRAVAMDKKQQTVDRWNEGKIPMLLVHAASSGHGLSLQYGSNQMCFFTLGFALEEYEQVIERIGPMRQMQAGLNRPVIVHYLIAEGTVERHVYNVVTGKATVQQEFQQAILDYHNREKKP